MKTLKAGHTSPTSPVSPLSLFQQAPKYVILAILLGIVLNSCTPAPQKTDLNPDMIVYFGEEDSTVCRILQSELMQITVVDVEHDTSKIETGSIDRIIELATGTDVTTAYVDRTAIKNEMAKRAVLSKREKLRGDVKAGLRKKAELDRLPIALLSAQVDSAAPPVLRISVLNLSSKVITQFRARITCLDAKGKPVKGKKAKDHIFEALSKLPIQPDEEFSTALILKNRPTTRKVKTEIIGVTFADKTSWKGRIEETKL